MVALTNVDLVPIAGSLKRRVPRETFPIARVSGGGFVIWPGVVSDFASSFL
jgi:hypothetical protein